MSRPGPLSQMTMALVALTISIVMLADLLLGLSPDPQLQRDQLRRQLAESLAVQVASLLQVDDVTTLSRSLRDIVGRVPDVRSAAVRRHDGSLVASAGPHVANWKAAREGAAVPDQVTVPLVADGRRWGGIEVSYRPDSRSWLHRLWDMPVTRLLLFISVAGAGIYAMYMRRALQHLDPASVIPDRVQRAFDAMAEGVVVLDAKARVLLANKAFGELHPEAQRIRVGQSLSAVPWLAGGLNGDAAAHPWASAMASKQNTSGDSLVVHAGAGAAAGGSAARGMVRRLVVNCAPITDASGGVRGCLVTFDDVSELHRTNEALQQAMKEAWAAKEEVLQKNVELQRLATRDPLSGCLNRRAFMDSAAALLDQARSQSRPLSCLMLDIDHFKLINDTHGHAVGDLVIQEVARELQQSARAVDLVCRYGGEEFCIIAPELDASAVFAVGERLRARVEAEAGPSITDARGMRVTVSVGIAQLGGRSDTLAALIDRADQALYQAKRAGRNRVQSFIHQSAAELVAAD